MADARQWQSFASNAGGALSQEDADALAASGVNPLCIIQCVIRLVRCGGPTDPDCRAQFVECLIGCIGGGGSND